MQRLPTQLRGAFAGLASRRENAQHGVPMKLPRLLLPLLLAGAVPVVSAQDATAPAAEKPAHPVFGNYEAIVYDATMLQGVRVDPNGDIFLMFQPDKRDAQVHIRISMAEGAQYRKWFNGEEDLVAQENAFREPNTWTDRVQTTANYIEYRAGDHLFLHLKKLKG
jgi:hypothetical protein